MTVRNRIARAAASWRSWAVLTLTWGVAFSAAAGTLTLVEVVPNVAPPGTQVSIIAHKTGTDNCGWQADVYIDDGDNNPGNDVLYTPFEAGTPATKGFGGMDPTVAQLSFTFNEVNDYRIEISGVQHNNKPPCSGSATASLKIEDPDMGGGGPGLGNPGVLMEACKVIDCATTLFYIPSVTSHFGFTKPGGVVAWIGKGFGPLKGKVTIHYTGWNGASKSANLQILEWTKGMVGTKIPANLTAFRQQTAQVVVETSQGKTATHSFTLFPINKIKLLSSSDIQTLKCGDDANFNACGSNWSGPGTIRGWHKNSCTIWFAGCYVDDDDWDKYKTVTLKNDWTIAWVNTTKSYSSSNEWISGPGSPSGSATSWQANYHWHVSPSDTVEYRTFIDVEGPRGVPHK